MARVKSKLQLDLEERSRRLRSADQIPLNPKDAAAEFDRRAAERKAARAERAASVEQGFPRGALTLSIALTVLLGGAAAVVGVGGMIAAEGPTQTLVELQDQRQEVGADDERFLISEGAVDEAATIVLAEHLETATAAAVDVAALQTEFSTLESGDALPEGFLETDEQNPQEEAPPVDPGTVPEQALPEGHEDETPDQHAEHAEDLGSHAGPSAGLLASVEHRRLLAPYFDEATFVVAEEDVYTTTAHLLAPGEADPRMPWFQRLAGDGKHYADGSSFAWESVSVVASSSDRRLVDALWLCRDTATGDVLAWARSTWSPTTGQFGQLDVGITQLGGTQDATGEFFDEHEH